MKNRFVVFSCLCFLSLLLLAACGAPGPGESAFAATVLEVSENALLVLGDGDAEAGTPGEQYWVALGGASVLDEEGKALTEGLEWLDRVEITYNGAVAETYPYQVKAVTVKRLPREPLTLSRLLQIEEKGEEIVWADFAPYQGSDVGSGLCILRYQLEDGLVLLVGGTPSEEKPWYIRLTRDGGEEYVEIREGSVQDFVDGKAQTVVKTAGDYPAAIMVEGVVYLLGQAIPAEVEEQAILGRTTSYTDGWPARDGETNFSRELDLPYARVAEGVVVLYRQEWRLCTPQ